MHGMIYVQKFETFLISRMFKTGVEQMITILDEIATAIRYQEKCIWMHVVFHWEQQQQILVENQEALEKF